MQTNKELENKRLNLLKGLIKYKNAIQGSLVLLKRKCGTNKKYPAYYLSKRVRGKTKLIYIPKDKVNKVRKGVAEYKILKKKIKKLFALNEKIIIKEIRGSDKNEIH